MIANGSNILSSELSDKSFYVKRNNKWNFTHIIVIVKHPIYIEITWKNSDHGVLSESLHALLIHLEAAMCQVCFSPIVIKLLFARFIECSPCLSLL